MNILFRINGLKIATSLLIILVTAGLFTAHARAELIQVCIKKKTGAVRVLLAPINKSCKKTETLEQWSTGIQVVDSTGQIIGTHVFAASVLSESFNGSFAIRNFAGTNVLLPINFDGSSGFVQGYNNGDLVFWHTTADCSGQRYLLGSAGIIQFAPSMMPMAIIFQSTAYYPQLPYQDLPINSIENIPEGGDPSQQGTCEKDSGNGGTYPLGVVQTGDLPAFVPPFHLQ